MMNCHSNEQKTILAIDPGNIESGYALIRMPDFELLAFGKQENEYLLDMFPEIVADEVAIEMVASYGMPVGKDVFETCVWIGRFIEVLKECKTSFVYRKDEKICLCGNLKAKDNNIRHALIDRYATFDFKSGKGTKKKPDTFHGVANDMWQAIAVGVTHYETKGESENA